jgi:hypothetical protein
MFSSTVLSGIGLAAALRPLFFGWGGGREKQGIEKLLAYEVFREL